MRFPSASIRGGNSPHWWPWPSMMGPRGVNLLPSPFVLPIMPTPRLIFDGRNWVVRPEGFTWESFWVDQAPKR